MNSLNVIDEQNNQVKT